MSGKLGGHMSGAMKSGLLQRCYYWRHCAYWLLCLGLLPVAWDDQQHRSWARKKNPRQNSPVNLQQCDFNVSIWVLQEYVKKPASGQPYYFGLLLQQVFTVGKTQRVSHSSASTTSIWQFSDIIFRLDALALSVIATATWLAGWLGGCHTPVLYQNG